MVKAILNAYSRTGAGNNALQSSHYWHKCFNYKEVDSVWEDKSLYTDLNIIQCTHISTIT